MPVGGGALGVAVAGTAVAAGVAVLAGVAVAAGGGVLVAVAVGVVVTAGVPVAVAGGVAVAVGVAVPVAGGVPVAVGVAVAVGVGVGVGVASSQGIRTISVVTAPWSYARAVSSMIVNPVGRPSIWFGSSRSPVSVQSVSALESTQTWSPISKPVSSTIRIVVSPALAFIASVLQGDERSPQLAWARAPFDEASANPMSAVSTPAASNRAPTPLGQFFMVFLPLS